MLDPCWGKRPATLSGTLAQPFLGEAGGAEGALWGAGPREGVRSASALDLLSPAAWARPTGPEQAPNGSGTSLPATKQSLTCRPPAPTHHGPRPGSKNRPPTGPQQEERQTERATGPSVRFALSGTFALSRFLPGPFRTVSRLPQQTRPGTSREQVLNRLSRHEPPPPPAGGSRRFPFPPPSARWSRPGRQESRLSLQQ